MKMQHWVLDDCLQQLVKVYAFAEQQYINAALNSYSPILKAFFEQRAFERSDFIDDVRILVHSFTNFFPFERTFERLSLDHIELYGQNALNTILLIDIDYMIIDKRALEICNCLLSSGMPKNVEVLLTLQATNIESTILSIQYLKALYED